jgi:hypothetical protein
VAEEQPETHSYGVVRQRQLGLEDVEVVLTKYPWEGTLNSYPPVHMSLVLVQGVHTWEREQKLDTTHTK